MRVEPGVGLFATPEWTDYGLSLLRDDRFKYFSPTFREEWTHPQTGVKYSNVLTGAALTVDPFCLGMKEYKLSEGWTSEDVTLNAATVAKPPESIPTAGKGQTFEELLAELGCIHDRIRDQIKGQKGAPGTRHQLEMVSNLLGRIAELKNKKKEATMPMSEIVSEIRLDGEVKRLSEEAAALRETIKTKELREAKLAETMKQLAADNRKMHVHARLTELLAKNLVKAGHQHEIESDLVKLSEMSDAITLSEGSKVDMLSEVAGFVEKYCHAVKLSETVKGTAAVDTEPAPKEGAELSDADRIKKYATEHKISYIDATIALREQKTIK